MTFKEAVECHPEDVARIWGDRRRWPHDLHPDWRPDLALRELAAMSALAYFTTIFQASKVHLALKGGMSLRQVADAVGCTPEEVAKKWRKWADFQAGLSRDGIGGEFSPAERDRLAAVVDALLAAERARDALTDGGFSAAEYD